MILMEDRKFGKEGQRRSPRISALEAHAAYGSSESSSKSSSAATPPPPNNSMMIHQEPPAFQTTTGVTIKKRKLITATASASASVPLKTPSYSTFMPEKRILELVLDTLQRRDTYEIFAEPVDPNEVEDYYAIIEEPMDFGTMRAKLHEGMYKSLEQFEHDVFLIFNNAMHFNSSGTIYFRQARAINELARKVFDVLKTNPDKFELEFSSETKRKVVGRRNPGGFRDSTDSEEITTIDGMSSKNVSCSSRSTSHLHRKSFKAINHGCSDIAKHVDGRHHLEVHKGAKDHSSRYRSSEDDKRCTYTPPLSLIEDESIFSTVYGGKLKLQFLQRVNQQDVGYRDSLMLFVKDLGPTAQNIAKRKLLGCEIRTAAAAATTCALWRPQSINNTTPTASHRFSDHPNNEMRSPNPKGKMQLQIAPGGETAYISGETETDQNAKVEEGILFNHSRGSSFSGCDKGSFPNVLYHGGFSNVSAESRMENKCKLFQSSLQPPWPLEFCKSQQQSSDSKSVTTGEISSDESIKISKPNQTIPLAPSFVFTLPYLKTRLDQLNSSSEQYTSFSQQDSSSSAKKRSFLAQPMRYQGFS